MSPAISRHDDGTPASGRRWLVTLRRAFAFAITLGLSAAMGVAASLPPTLLTACGGCDFEAQCLAKAGRSDSDLGLLCDYVGEEITFNDTHVFWGTNPEDPLPYEECECEVVPGVGGTLQNCVYSTSDTCATLTDCVSCSSAFFCGWCNGQCTVTYGSDDTSGCVPSFDPASCP